MPHRPSTAELQKVFVGRLLVPKLHRALQEANDRELAAVGLTTQQGLILASCELGEATTLADLARIYRLEASSITRLVERLVKKNFLTRRRSKADRRHVFIQITPEGKRCLWEAIPVAMRVAKRAWNGVTDAEKVALEHIVEKVLKNLETDSGALDQIKKPKGEQ